MAVIIFPYERCFGSGRASERESGRGFAGGVMGSVAAREGSEWRTGFTFDCPGVARLNDDGY
jgi:hypothetical protein